MFLALVKMLVAAVAGAAAVLAAWPLLAEVAVLIPGRIGPRAVETLGLLSLGSGVFLLAAWLLRLPEVALLLARTPKAPAGRSG